MGKELKKNGEKNRDLIRQEQPEGKHTGEKLSRRRFFRGLWGGMGVIAGFEFIWVSSAFLRPRQIVADPGSTRMKIAGKVSVFANGSVTPFRSGQFYLVRMPDGGFLALSIKCTHLGCSVMWDESQEAFVCPCHASRFDMTGEAINPPATRALDHYPVYIGQDMVKVDIGRPLKRDSFKVSQLAYA